MRVRKQSLVLLILVCCAWSCIELPAPNLELTESEVIVALKEGSADQERCFAALANNGESMAVAGISPSEELPKRGKYRVILRVSEKDGVIT